jgi:L,D-transpeptidase ErfK/SrfK
MEAHTPLEDSGAIELEKIYAKLRNIEKKSARTLDWKKLRKCRPRPGGFRFPSSRSSRK